MKKLIFILGILLSLSTISAYAEQTRAEVYIWNHGSIMNSRERAPIRLPTIYIVFDSTDRSIEIHCSAECEATVFLYDMKENLIAVADSLDTVLDVPESISSGAYLKIESELWYATATISL